MNIVDLGLIRYTEAVRLQEGAVQRVREGGPGTLFLLEHPPVITFGRNGGEENLPFGRDFFLSRGVELVHSSRGGNITCHFPGQLVAYPIMCIDKRVGGLRRFFADMEECAIQAIASFGLESGRVQGKPGVWIGEHKKIASIGIAVKHWITSHGLALNVARDLSLFELVSPCGLAGVQATSLLRELDRDDITMDDMKCAFTNAFKQIIGLDEQGDRHD